ncbi:solute carrier family 15 member 4-like [Tubulanus polymorphus]|uniref:solute carrier family 15 member 4-like n=1 Tax=Tubulanus polymorphus TaxID=672921 RepID=UPI003DA493E0
MSSIRNRVSTDENTSLLSNTSSNAGAPATGQRLIRNGTDSSPKPFARKCACAAILASNTLERLAFYGLTGNFILFLQQSPYVWMSYNATNGLFIFMGLTYMLCLFGGWLADTYLGRCKSICLFFLIYICGYIFMPILGSPLDWATENETTKLPAICPHGTNSSPSSPWIPLCEGDDCNQTEIVQKYGQMKPAYAENCSWVVYLSITLMAIGCGTVKTNIAPFGADQVRGGGPETMRGFFNWFYWSVNIGSLLALGPIAFFQQEFSFFIGYIIPCACLGCALLVFLAGLPCYSIKPATGSIIGNCFRVLLEACRVNHKRLKTNRTMYSITESSSFDEAGSCIDYAKVRYGGSFQDSVVDDLKALLKIVLIFVTMIPYWIVIFQMETTFLIQGLHMRLRWGNIPNETIDPLSNSTNPFPPNNSFQFSAATLSLFDVVVIIILIPLMDKVLYPYFDRKGRPLTLFSRITVGMVFAAVSMLVAGIVEYYRLKIYWRNDRPNPVNQKIGNRWYFAADLNIMVQIPQYTLIGISEVFASIAGLELAYSQAPRTMQGVIMGFFWFFSGVGSFLGTAIMQSFQNVWFFSWDLGDINCRIPCPHPHQSKWCHECHLDNYFFVLAGIQVFGIFLFIIISYKLKLLTVVTKIHVPNSLINRRSSGGNVSVRSRSIGNSSTISYGSSNFEI